MLVRWIRWMCLLCACALADQHIPNNNTQTDLGEQCFQDDTCQLHDKHAVCAQVDHNAICKCKQGYHIVTVSRPTNNRSSFCVQEKSSSRHYGTSEGSAQQEEESSAGQSETKDEDNNRVGAARAAAFILISCRPSTSDTPLSSPGKTKRAKKLGYGKTGSDPAVHSTSSLKAYNLKWYQRDQQRRHSTKNREAKGTPPSHCSTEQLIHNSTKETCSRNSQNALSSKDKSKTSSVSRIEHKALVHHSAASCSPDAVIIPMETLITHHQSTAKEHNQKPSEEN